MGTFWSNLCLNCIIKRTWFVKTSIWSVIDRSRVRFPVAAALIIFFFPPFFSLFWLGSPSVPLEFPKLANAQPSNFGPLRIYVSKMYLNFRAKKVGYLPNRFRLVCFAMFRMDPIYDVVPLVAFFLPLKQLLKQAGKSLHSEKLQQKK